MALKKVDALNLPRHIKSCQYSIISPEREESTSTIITQEQKENNLPPIPHGECKLTIISQEHEDISLSTVFQEDERDTWTTISLSSSPLVSPIGSRKGMSLQLKILIFWPPAIRNLTKVVLIMHFQVILNPFQDILDYLETTEMRICHQENSQGKIL